MYNVRKSSTTGGELMNENIYEIYEGREPYLFISYSHRDWGRVRPIIRGLQQMGYRLWYDTGIAIGSRWPDIIAQHLQRSSCVVAFVSANAMASDYCQEEMFFAMEERKPIMPVHLEKTILPPGLKMRLSSRQAIYRYDYRSDADFLSKLDREESIQPSKKTSIPTVRPGTPAKTQKISRPRSNAEALLQQYIADARERPSQHFISAGNLAAKRRQFDYRDMVAALNSNNLASQCINRMRKLKIIKEVGFNRFEMVLSSSDWQAFKALCGK